MCCIVLVFVPTEAHAQKFSSVIAPAGDWPKTRSSRQAWAAELLAEIGAIDAEIPTLSPEEAAWLKVEYDDEIAQGRGVSSRAMSARYSKIGATRFGKEGTSEQVGEDGAMESTNKTELLLELIANELLRMRLQMGSEADPEDLTRALAEKLDSAIIDARRKLGLPWNPLTR